METQNNKAVRLLDDGHAGFFGPIISGKDIGIPPAILEDGSEEQVLQYATERLGGLQINYDQTEVTAALISLSIRISQGAVLSDIKKKLGRAKMLEFCKMRLGISARTADNWISLFEHREVLIGTGLEPTKALRLLRAANSDNVKIDADNITFLFGDQEKTIGMTEARECTFVEFEAMINYARGIEKELKQSEGQLKKLGKSHEKELESLRGDLAKANREKEAMMLKADAALDELETIAQKHIDEVRQILVRMHSAEATMERNGKMFSITDAMAVIVGQWREELSYGEIMEGVEYEHDALFKKAQASVAQKAKG